ncbi:lanthionine synthetase LanC family protein [Aquimarina algiphila]|uniref:lanthionine synthetase LanC family protein n=1 Tax=Aquimarina algiphila TaxID=2047982 RepID=UPI00249231EA|nr:lanthionine synthetase LanC family protein [Aquimarina algiphila]
MKKIIAQIADELFENCRQMNAPTIEYDLGYLLFIATFYKYSKEEKYKKRSQVLLEEFLNVFEDNAESGGLFIGFEGAIWVIHYLEKCGIIDDKKFYVEDIEDYLIQSIKLDFKTNNFDLLYGSIGKLQYFLETPEHPDTNNLVNEMIQSLYQSKTETKLGIFWDEDGAKGIVNLGLAHGTPGVLIFLTRLKELGYQNPLINTLAEGIMKGLLNMKQKGANMCCFGDAYTYVEENTRNYSRLAWCYGDLGIMFAFLYAGEIFDNKKWREEGIKIGEYVFARGISDSGIIHFDDYSYFDTGFCHGLAGITYLTYRINQIVKDPEIQKRHEYWKKELLKNLNIQLNIENDVLQPWWRQLEEKPSVLDKPSILNGLSGVGLALLSLEYEESDWSNIFLIY